MRGHDLMARATDLAHQEHLRRDRMDRMAAFICVGFSSLVVLKAARRRHGAMIMCTCLAGRAIRCHMRMHSHMAQRSGLSTQEGRLCQRLSDVTLHLPAYLPNKGTSA